MAQKIALHAGALKTRKTGIQEANNATDVWPVDMCG
jgi:hypothetical protein